MDVKASQRMFEFTFGARIYVKIIAVTDAIYDIMPRQCSRDIAEYRNLLQSTIVRIESNLKIKGSQNRP